VDYVTAACGVLFHWLNSPESAVFGSGVWIGCCCSWCAGFLFRQDTGCCGSLLLRRTFEERARVWCRQNGLVKEGDDAVQENVECDAECRALETASGQAW